MSKKTKQRKRETAAGQRVDGGEKQTHKHMQLQLQHKHKHWHIHLFYKHIYSKNKLLMLL